MTKFKKCFLIMLIALFVTAPMVSSVMASCTSAQPARDLHAFMTKVDTSIDSLDENLSGACAMLAEGHSALGAVLSHHDASDSSSKTATNCHNCNGGLCQSQNLAPVLAEYSFYDSSDNFYTEKAINLKQVLLTRIPEPPKSLS